MESGKRSKQSLRVRKKVKCYDPDQESSKMRYRPCSKTGCNEKRPFCCLQSSDNCCRDGYTSRWYHMTLGEHFCNECFDHFYRPHKEGFQKYDKWFHAWYHASTVKPSIKRFVADEAMPYWLQCTLSSCGKWREVRNEDVSSEYIENFKCEILYGDSQKNPCSIPEEGCVSDVCKFGWIEQLAELPLLKKSPAAAFLKDFYEAGIGLSPLDKPSNIEVPQWIEPFSDAFNGESLIWPSPDVMEKDEKTYMLNILEQPTYLGMRNLIVTIWNMYPGKWLNADALNSFVVCRGLIRIYLLFIAKNIIKFLTRKGVINYGLVSPETEWSLLPLDNKESVIVIGSGISGLSAARHLQNLGIETIVLEASYQIGGRMRAENGEITTRWINGLINNPITVLSHQGRFSIKKIPKSAVFIDGHGKIISTDTVDRMIHQFSGIMHGAMEFARQASCDSNWFDTITKHQEDFHQLAVFSKEEDQIFKFLLNLTEIEYRVNCRDLTLKNYEVLKEQGNDGFVLNGCDQLLEKLSENLNIHFNTVVQEVNYSDSSVEVITSDKSFHATRVIVAVPLPILQQNKIQFDPVLPTGKIEAIKEFGNSMQETVILQFPTKFWSSILDSETGKFVITSCDELAFQYFVDISLLTKDKKPTLLTFITDSNINQIPKEDDELVEVCYNILKNTFKTLHKKIPKPSFSSVSHYCKNPFLASSGSFVKVGSKYAIYDEVAEPVRNTLFFAGEATYRKFPNSLSGAFLSGLREGARIADLICPIVPCTF